jgi:DNA-binding transcriptional ArsR family regulator
MSRKAPSALSDSARIFSALGDPTRLQLVTKLCDKGPMSITELASGAKVTRQAVTKHLKVLEDADVIKGSRHGREQIWVLEHKRLEVAQKFIDQISMQWDFALARLKKFVESPD